MFTELSDIGSIPSEPTYTYTGPTKNLTRKSPVLQVCTEDGYWRPALEKFVQNAFLRAHAARVNAFMPILVSLRDDNGDILAVCGYRSAFDHLLYLEDYLDEPVEMAIGKRIGRPLERRAIVEVGNFAAVDFESARRLMMLLPAHLVKQRYSWIAFTATRTIRHMLKELGAQPLQLCSARPNRIADPNSHWGNYYRRDPKVMAGYLPGGLELEAFKPRVIY